MKPAIVPVDVSAIQVLVIMLMFFIVALLSISSYMLSRYVKRNDAKWDSLFKKWEELKVHREECWKSHLNALVDLKNYTEENYPRKEVFEEHKGWTKTITTALLSQMDVVDKKISDVLAIMAGRRQENKD